METKSNPESMLTTFRRHQAIVSPIFEVESKKEKHGVEST